MQPVHEEALLEAVKSLVAIRSTADNPSGLRAAYEYVREFVLNKCTDVTIEEFESNGKPSFLAYRGDARPERFHIILNAHVDVVPGKPEQFQPIVADGKLYGRGAYDMKAAAMVLATMFCEYADKVPYALGFQLVTDEEVAGWDGTKYQVEQQGVRADFVLCGECGRLPDTYEIANEAKGLFGVELQFKGTTAHGAYPWRGDNAGLKATEFVRKLHELYPSPDEATANTTLTVTGISAGGAAHNQVPATATVRLDCRYAPDDTRFADEKAIKQFMYAIDPQAEVTDFLALGLPMRTDPSNPLLQELKAAAEDTEGAEFLLARRNGSDDGRFYAAVGGETVSFGIAGERQHGDDECITLEAFRSYLATMRGFLEKTLALEHTENYAEATAG